MTHRRKFFPLLAIAAFTTFMGLVAFSGVANNPHFETYRTVDVIRLMAAGGNFSIAFVALMIFILRPNFRSQDKAPEEKESH